LSSARALQVVQFLHRRGVDPTKLSAVGYGEYRPLVPNTTAENRRKNRRIEIFVDFEETQRN
jgi:chemotaxis protein MotB